MITLEQAKQALPDPAAMPLGCPVCANMACDECCSTCNTTGWVVANGDIEPCPDCRSRKTNLV
jgi:hypothetical protein